MQRQADEHRERMDSLSRRSQSVKRVDNLKGSKPHSHDERGRGDGVDYDNGKSELSSETQLVDVEEVEPTPIQQVDSSAAQSDEWGTDPAR